MHIENVLSVFDGHSGLMISLEKAGFTVGNYFSSEIDMHAIKASKACYPNMNRLGDVRNVRASDLPKIDLFGGGSPCQSFSFAGKRKGMATKCEIEILDLDHYLQLKSEGFEFEGQSYLFWEYMRILKEIQQINPKVYFFLENVEMGDKWERVITKAIGVKGIHINSALVSAQNRRRIYWTNIGMEPGGLFGDMQSIIPQPKDRGILLKDILESEVDEKYYIKNPKFGFDGLNLNAKGKTLRIGGTNSQTDKHNFDLIKIDVKGNVKNDQAKASCFTAGGNSGGNSGGNHSDMDLLCVAMRGRGDNNEQQLEPRNDNKTNAITSVQKDNLIIQLNKSTESGGKQPYQQNRVYSVEGVAPALCAYKSDLNIEVIGCDYRTDEGIRYREGGKTGTLAARARNDESCGQLASINSHIRRLTPRECGRLQTIPEHIIDTILNSGVSDSQIYKMFGNGWNIETIVHFLKYI